MSYLSVTTFYWAPHYWIIIKCLYIHHKHMSKHFCYFTPSVPVPYEWRPYISGVYNHIMPWSSFHWRFNYNLLYVLPLRQNNHLLSIKCQRIRRATGTCGRWAAAHKSNASCVISGLILKTSTVATAIHLKAFTSFKPWSSYFSPTLTSYKLSWCHRAQACDRFSQSQPTGWWNTH